MMVRGPFIRVCVSVCVCREHVGTHSSVNIMMPADISELFRSEGLHPRRMTLQPWATHRETRQYSKGVFLKSVTVCAGACVCVRVRESYVANAIN